MAQYDLVTVRLMVNEKDGIQVRDRIEALIESDIIKDKITGIDVYHREFDDDEYAILRMM